MTSFGLLHLMAVYFLFILIFSESRYKVHAVIIFLSSALNLYFELPISTNIDEYIHNRNVFILWDSATMLILLLFLAFDSVAWKQALLLTFATMTHIMITYHLTTTEPSLFSLFFYSYYDELIIMVGLLQMMVSYNGFIAALRRARELNSRVGVYIVRTSQSIYSFKKRRENP